MKRAPLNATIKITSACNLKCKHCHSSDFKPRMMPLEDFKRIICDLRTAGVFGVNLTGGEVQLHPDLIEMCSFVNSSHLRVTISTTATLMTPGAAVALKKAGVHGAHVSIDGPNAEVHDEIRRTPGALDAALIGISQLSNAGIPVMAVTTLSQFNYDQLGRTIDLAYATGAKAHKTNALVPTGRGKDVFGKAGCVDPKQAVSEWLAKKRYYAGRMQLKGEMAFLMQVGTAAYVNKEEPAVLRHGCPAGFTTCVITESGDVGPCSFCAYLSGGNMLDEDFSKIWNESELFTKLRERRVGAPCNNCEYLAECGGCRARALGLKGDLFAGDPLCWKSI